MKILGQAIVEVRNGTGTTKRQALNIFAKQMVERLFASS